jgi:hypothetical protein
VVGPKSFDRERSRQAAGIDRPSKADDVAPVAADVDQPGRARTTNPVGVPGFSMQVTPAPTTAVVHRNSTTPSPTMLPFRSKVATLRPPTLDGSERAATRTPGAIAPPPAMPSARPNSPFASTPPLPVEASGADFYDARTVMASADPWQDARSKNERTGRLSAMTESSLVVHTPEPTRAVRRKRMGLAAVGGCLLIAGLVGSFLWKRHDRTATKAVLDASTRPVDSAAPAPTAASAAVPEKGALVDSAPAPSSSAGSARRTKPTAPRPSRPFKSRHK